MAKKPYRRHSLLLQDARIKAWYDEVVLGSEATAKNYFRMIGICSERSGVTPEMEQSSGSACVTLTTMVGWTDRLDPPRASLGDMGRGRSGPRPRGHPPDCMGWRRADEGGDCGARCRV